MLRLLPRLCTQVSYAVGPTDDYPLFAGFIHLGAGLACGFTGLAAGYAIGYVGDSVRDTLAGFCSKCVNMNSVCPSIRVRVESVCFNGFDPHFRGSIGFIRVRGFSSTKERMFTNSNF